jgi:hypothetical protein
MTSSGMGRRVALVRTDVSEEHIVSILHSVLRLLATTNVVPSSPILVTLMVEEIHSCKSSFHTGATRRHISKDDILQLECSAYNCFDSVRKIDFFMHLVSASLSDRNKLPIAFTRTRYEFVWLWLSSLYNIRVSIRKSP